MRELAYLDSHSGGGAVSALYETNIVHMTVKRRKGTKVTDKWQHNIDLLGGQLLIEGTEVTFWIQHGRKLKAGEHSMEVQVGGFEGKDQILEISVKVERMSDRINADLYNTPGLEAAVNKFRTDMNMALNRCLADLKVNLWHIGATLNSQRAEAGKRNPNEGSPRNPSDGVPKGKRRSG